MLDFLIQWKVHYPFLIQILMMTLKYIEEKLSYIPEAPVIYEELYIRRAYRDDCYGLSTK